MIAKLVRILPIPLFILSGAYALVYEVTWAKYLSLFIGNTTLAHMCVLAAFMGGLTLGSIFIGMMTPRLRRPLAGYGVLELAIGMYALLFPLFIHPLQSSVLKAASGIPIGIPAWAVLKIAVAVGVLLWPTFLMGGTFPMLMKHYQPGREGEDKAEWLYLANCAGAVGGALVAGFSLIPYMGLSATLLSVGSGNVVLGLAAVCLGLIGPVIGTQKKSADAKTPDRRLRNSWPIYAAITLSGITAMIYELVWIRIFSVTLGSSTYSFTLMLAAFITGIALGSTAVGVIPWVRRNPLTAFAVAEVAISFAIIAGIPQYEKLPYIFWKWAYLLNRTEDTFGLFNFVKYSLCFAIMAIPTFFFGMTLPLAMKSSMRRDEQIGRDSGMIYGANTAGNIAGALLAGVVLIPLTGLRHSLEIALLANVGIGVLLLWFAQFRYRKPIAVAACGLAVVFVLILPQWSPTSLASGSFRSLHYRPPSSWRDYKAINKDSKVLFYSDDGSATVAVIANPVERILFINGKGDASSVNDMHTQILVGQLPMFFKPDARDVLLVGLGSGMTAGSVLTHPDAKLDCLEISPAVVKAARHFDDVSWNARKNPRLNLMVEDARTYVTVTGKTYDVVISEPSNPWIAGIGNLFSAEYFQSVDRILKPRGILVQWVHGYEISDDLVTMIIRTLNAVFPYVYVFQGHEMDYIMLASRVPLAADFPAMERMMRVEPIKKDLSRIGTDSLSVLLARQMFSAQAVAQIAGEGPLNTDDLPLLEYQAPRAQYTHGTAVILDTMDERFQMGNDLFSVQYLKTHPLDRKVCRSLIELWGLQQVNNRRLEVTMLHYYLSRWPDDRWALERYRKLVADEDISEALAASKRLVPLESASRALDLRASILFSERSRLQSAFTPQDFTPALKLLDQALALKPEDAALRQKRQIMADFAR